MRLILSSLLINGDLNQPAVTVTDKAYGTTSHVKPIHTEVEPWMMALANKLVQLTLIDYTIRSLVIS